MKPRRHSCRLLPPMGLAVLSLLVVACAQTVSNPTAIVRPASYPLLAASETSSCTARGRLVHCWGSSNEMFPDTARQVGHSPQTGLGRFGNFTSHRQFDAPIERLLAGSASFAILDSGRTLHWLGMRFRFPFNPPMSSVDDISIPPMGVCWASGGHFQCQMLDSTPDIQAHFSDDDFHRYGLSSLRLGGHAGFVRRGSSVYLWHYSLREGRTIERVRDVFSGYNRACFIMESDRIECIGVIPGLGEHPMLPSGVVPVRFAQHVHGTSVCFIDSQGGVWCGGENGYGELGQGHSRAVEGFVRVPLPEPVERLTTGVSHAVAVLRSGRIFAWGLNVLGQVDPTSSAPHLPLVDVSRFAPPP